MKMSANMTEALLAVAAGSKNQDKAPAKASVSALEKRGLVRMTDDGEPELTRDGKDWVAMING